MIRFSLQYSPVCYNEVGIVTSGPRRRIRQALSAVMVEYLEAGNSPAHPRPFNTGGSPYDQHPESLNPTTMTRSFFLLTASFSRAAFARTKDQLTPLSPGKPLLGAETHRVNQSLSTTGNGLRAARPLLRCTCRYATTTCAPANRCGCPAHRGCRARSSATCPWEPSSQHDVYFKSLPCSLGAGWPAGP